MEDYFCRHRYHAPVSRPIDRPLTSKPSREGYWEGGRRVTRRVHFCDQVYPASGRGASPSAWGYYFAYIQVAIPYTVARLGNRWTKINTCDETLSLSSPLSFSLLFLFDLISVSPRLDTLVSPVNRRIFRPSLFFLSRRGCKITDPWLHRARRVARPRRGEARKAKERKKGMVGGWPWVNFSSHTTGSIRTRAGYFHCTSVRTYVIIWPGRRCEE